MAPPPSVLMNRTINRQSSVRSSNNPLQRSPRFTSGFSSGWSPRGGGQSMFVVDPKTLATRLLIRPSRNTFVETNSKLVNLFVWLKGASERWFSHVLLLIALILYACLGGWIFNEIEGKFEDKQNAIFRELHYPVEKITNSSIDELWHLRTNYLMPPADNLTRSRMPEPLVDPRFSYYVNFILDRYSQVVHTQCIKKVDAKIESFTETDEWSFMGSCFFSMAVFTTIGYGDRTPVTTEGKVATMIYSFFGIPLLLIVLADYGKIFTKWIKYCVLFVRKLYYNRNLSKVRRMGRKATKAGQLQEALLEGLAKIQRNPPFFVDPNTKKVTMWPSGKNNNDEEAKIARGGSLNRKHAPPKVIVCPETSATGSSVSPPSTPIPPEALTAFEDLDDEFNLPITLALFILLLYIFMGAIIFWIAESWPLLHSFYFVFISMSTIGFGDFVPNQYRVMFYAAMYLIFGLALTSMCINVIQEKLSSLFEEARLTIGESIGLDPTTPITMEMDPTQRKASKDLSELKKKDSIDISKSSKKDNNNDHNKKNGDNNNNNNNNKELIIGKKAQSKEKSNELKAQKKSNLKPS